MAMCGAAGCSARTSSKTGTHRSSSSWARSSSSEQGLTARALSHNSASCSSAASSRGSSGNSFSAGWRRCCRAAGSTRRNTVTVRALFEPPPFQPSKLSISFGPGTTPVSPAPPDSRRYTLTHNDITGELWLTVGADYNTEQISGFYTRLLRDEVIAEWRSDGAQTVPSLHLFCHVSGEERWLAPPALRNYIFRREMPLVLDCVMHAEQELLKLQPQLARAPVFVHFQSAVEHLDSIECWGILGERSSWQAVPTSILKRLLFGLIGLPLAPDPAPTKATLSPDLLQQPSVTRGFSMAPVIAAATLEIDDDVGPELTAYGSAAAAGQRQPHHGVQEGMQAASASSSMPSNGHEQSAAGGQGGDATAACLSPEGQARSQIAATPELAAARSSTFSVCLGQEVGVGVPVAGALNAALEDKVAGVLQGSLLLGMPRKASELLSHSGRK